MQPLGRDQPVAVNAVVGEVVDVDRLVDADADLTYGLVVGGEIDQQDLLFAPIVCDLDHFQPGDQCNERESLWSSSLVTQENASMSIDLWGRSMMSTAEASKK